jgi:CubicO group peptidase (beta-lactamase class C family)
MEALGAVARWPVGAAAAGVVRPGEAPVTSGPAGRRFGWASVTKLASALAVWVAVEEGTVGPDDPCGPPGATVLHLLAHASGLGPDGQVLAPPGRRRIYADRGYDHLAAHVAARSGMPFAAYLAGAVLEPWAWPAPPSTRGSRPATG